MVLNKKIGDVENDTCAQIKEVMILALAIVAALTVITLNQIPYEHVW